MISNKKRGTLQMKIHAIETEQQLKTNYWESDIASQGDFFALMQKNHCTLLFPKKMEKALSRIILAEEVVISKGPLLEVGPHLEFLFEDDSAAPIAVYCSHYDGGIVYDDDCYCSLTCSIWVSYGKIKTFPTYYREVSKLPCLQPWTD
jgi:hypothetical protein